MIDMKSLLLSALKPVATWSFGLGKDKKLFIMIFHRILDEPDFMRPGETDKLRFTWQMDLLAKYFNVLPFAEAMTRLQDKTLPARAVCVTFDDGYADNYLNALPILQQSGLPATFFIASGYLDGGRMWNDSVIEAVRNSPNAQLDLTNLGLGILSVESANQKAQAASDIIIKIKHLDPTIRQQYTDYVVQQSGADLPDNLMMTTQQLQQLHASGMEIGGHTVSHPIIAKITDAQLEQELSTNKQTLENILGTQLRFFAYPNGKPGQDYLPEQVGIIKRQGYEAAVSTEWAVASSNSDLWQLPRFTPWDTQPVKFMIRMIRMCLEQSNVPK
jgi:peptidoglycan/xylan/chitin deacetylase (PgdA/CDA1 family)